MTDMISSLPSASAVTKENSQEMLEKMARDYSVYFNVDIFPSISKLQEFLEESAAKLDELSSLFEMNVAETNDWIEQTLPEIIQISVKSTTDIKHRIDTLEELIQALKFTLDKQEAQIVQAEQCFPNSSSSLRYMLSYFRKPPEQHHEPVPKVPFEPVSISVDNYFSDGSSVSTGST